MSAVHSPYIYQIEGDALVLNRPFVVHAVLFWQGNYEGYQRVTMTIETCVSLHQVALVDTLCDFLKGFQGIGMLVSLPFAIVLGEDMTIMIEDASNA